MSSLIYCYGFERAGFTVPDSPIAIKNIGTVQFVSYSGRERLDNAQGVITLQGLFEKIDRRQGKIGFDYEELRLRQHQVVNLLEANGWICFLVGEMVDSLPFGRYASESKSFNATDLCKRILNNFNVERLPNAQRAIVDVLDDAFRPFIKDYGIVKTTFHTRYRSDTPNWKSIARVGDRDAAIQFSNRVFFIPFQSTATDANACQDIAASLTKAVCDYQAKHNIEIPEWLQEFSFQREVELIEQREFLRDQVVQVENELGMWSNYKAILSTSGELLKEASLPILTQFFGFNVDPTDEFREDAKLIEADGTVVAVIEFKGTKGGIKREHITQVDSNRERSELPVEVPGILIINNAMAKEGVDQRVQNGVATEQVQLAKALNVMVIRSIDLLYMMKQLESSSMRREELLKLINAGGGWLCADNEGYTIVDGTGD